MVERIQDLNLPNTNITKIIRDSLPSDVNMDKEARVAIARATSVFIMYLSSNAAAIAHKHNHKTFSAQDVLDSISEMEFKSFLAPMKTALVQYQKSMKDKKDNKKNSLEARKSTGGSQSHILQMQPSVTITPIAAVNISPTKHMTAKAVAQVKAAPITISSDIIEIDDSD